MCVHQFQTANLYPKLKDVLGEKGAPCEKNNLAPVEMCDEMVSS